MEPLANQEVAEANAQLARHLEAASKASFFLGISVLCVVVVQVIVLFFRFTGSHSTHETTVLGALLTLAWFAYGIWWHVRARSAFAQLRSSCLKLQRAGFVLQIKYELFRHVLVAKPNAEEAGVKALDFEHITPRQLRASTE